MPPPNILFIPALRETTLADILEGARRQTGASSTMDGETRPEGIEYHLEDVELL